MCHQNYNILITTEKERIEKKKNMIIKHSINSWINYQDIYGYEAKVETLNIL